MVSEGAEVELKPQFPVLPWHSQGCISLNIKGQTCKIVTGTGAMISNSNLSSYSFSFRVNQLHAL